MQKINALIAATIIFGSSALHADVTQEHVDHWKARIEECKKKTGLYDHIDCMIPNADTKSINIKSEIYHSSNPKQAYISFIDQQIEKLAGACISHEGIQLSLSRDPEDRAEYARMSKLLAMEQEERKYVIENVHTRRELLHNALHTRMQKILDMFARAADSK